MESVVHKTFCDVDSFDVGRLLEWSDVYDELVSNQTLDFNNLLVLDAFFNLVFLFCINSKNYKLHKLVNLK